MEIMNNKASILLMAGLLLSGLTVAAQEKTQMLQDTLPAAVKTDIRQMSEHLPGSFRTDMSALRGKVLSPVGENDPVKFAMTRPGVSAGAEGFSAYFARGGNLGNNLMTLDGVRLYGASHLLGLTTAVPSEAVSSVDFRVGGFGGETGGMTASHIALSSPVFKHDKLKGSAFVSNTFLGASVEMPVSDGRASVFAAGRWSPFSLEYGLLKTGFDPMGKMPSLRIGVGDLYVKAGWQPLRHHQFEVSALGTLDRYVLGFSNAEYHLGWENAIGHIVYRFEKGNTLLKADVSYNHFLNRMEHNATVRGDKSALQLQSRIGEQVYSFMAVQKLMQERIRLSAGLKHQRSVMSPAAAKQSESTIIIVENVPFTESVSHPVLTGAFLEMEGFFGPFNVMAAVRGNHYRNRAQRQRDVYQGWAAEFSARAKWRILEGFGIEATYDNRVQFDHTLEGTPLGWSLDLLVPSTPNLLPERTKQGYGGVFTSFGGQALTVGGYYKRMENLVYYTDAMALFTAAAQGWSDHAQVGSGTSYGVEFLYEGRWAGASWNLAYTWSKTDRQFPYINEGRPFPARYDRRHIVVASALWKGATAAFTLQSGHWETVAAGHYAGYLPDGTVTLDYYTHPDNYQMPMYLRLDLGYQFVFKSGLTAGRALEHSLTVGVYNVLNRHNPSMFSYDSDTKTWNFVSLFPVMPSVNYRLQF